MYNGFFLLMTIKTNLMHTILCSLHFKNYFEIYPWKQIWSSDRNSSVDVCMLNIQCIQINIEHKSSFIVYSKVYLVSRIPAICMGSVSRALFTCIFDLSV